MKDKQVQIVIIGAGYAGVMTAVRLAGRVKRRKNVAITLVNGSEQFTERPRLHEIATGKRPDQHPLREMLAGTAVQFCQGWVTAVQSRKKVISIKTAEGEEQIPYDYLVYALGSQVDRDSVPGVRQWAYSLDAVGERTAEPLHKRLKQLAETGGQVVVVGSGPTGIEVAGEVHDTFPTLDVSIVTAGEFGSFTTERVQGKIRQAVSRLGIGIIEQALVCEIREGEIQLENGDKIPFDVCVWAGGFKGTSLGKEAGIKVNGRNQLLVDQYLRSLSHPAVYAVGDAAFPVGDTGAPYRMSLFTALTTAAHTADNLANVINGKNQRTFGFSTYGQGIAIGHRNAVGFNSFPNDRPIGPILTGRVGLTIRNFFVWLILQLLTVERKFPGFFFWPGKNRGKTLTDIVSTKLLTDN